MLAGQTAQVPFGLQGPRALLRKPSDPGCLAMCGHMVALRAGSLRRAAGPRGFSVCRRPGRHGRHSVTVPSSPWSFCGYEAAAEGRGGLPQNSRLLQAWPPHPAFSTALSPY